VFSALGLDYIGPVDGHDIPAMESAFRDARDRRRPVVVHCVTRKGRGYAPAEANEVDHMHGAPAFDPGTGRPLRAGRRTWTAEAGACLLEMAQLDPRIVAITAAMLDPVGLTELSVRLPGQVLDVGIAEQHAVAMAAGLAIGGLRPVVCLYAAFVNRALDQVLADVALHNLPVTFAIDRAGVTGEDGPSHHGLWDLAILSAIPGLRIAAPRDGLRLRELLSAAVWGEGPAVVRYPKGELCAPIPAVRSAGPVDVLRAGEPNGALIVAVGPMVSIALAAAESLATGGLSVTVADPRWVCPVPGELVSLAAGYRMVVTVEDGSREGGFGSALVNALSDAELLIPVHRMGLPASSSSTENATNCSVPTGWTAPASPQPCTRRPPAGVRPESQSPGPNDDRELGGACPPRPPDRLTELVLHRGGTGHRHRPRAARPVRPTGVRA
jgi:1-deoxy-D-xylulose-5-phosphate synthase